MEAVVMLPRFDGAERRLDMLEAENARLRDQLAQASAQADRERQRSRRLGRIIEAASRVEAGRFAVERPRTVAPEIRAPLAGLRPSAPPPASNDYLELLECDGCLITASAGGPALSGVQDEAEAIGRPWIDVWTRPEDREAAAGALDQARLGRPSRFQAQIETAPSSGGGTWRSRRSARPPAAPSASSRCPATSPS